MVKLFWCLSYKQDIKKKTCFWILLYFGIFFFFFFKIIFYMFVETLIIMLISIELSWKLHQFENAIFSKIAI